MGSLNRRRERFLVLGALVIVTLLAWGELLAMEDAMGGAMSMKEMGVQPWTLGHFIDMTLMWVVMMVAMMVPSAAPMVLLYTAVARKASAQGDVLAPTAIFLAGYLVVWSGFSLLATGVQMGLDQAALLSPMLVVSSPWIGAGLLMAAGIYQMSPAKDACLTHCRAPAHFLASHWHPGGSGALRMGLVHGLYCLGCCWILMALLFVGGVMNMVWIAAISIFVLIEKILPFGVWAGRAAGAAAAVSAVAFLLVQRG